MKEIEVYILIEKELTGRITEPELQLLEQWKTASAENQKLYTALSRTWETSSSYHPPLDIDTAGEFDKLTDRIRKSGTLEAKVLPINRNLRSFMKIAAGFLFIGMVVAWFFSSQQNKTQWKIVETKQNEIKEIILPDQTKVVLNQLSVLTYPTRFDDIKREVKLTGEAFFDVKRDVNQPFTIETTHTITTVLGTSFDIRAYQTESLTQIAVKTGRVRVQSDQVNASVQLEPMDITSYDNHARTFATKTDNSLKAFDWLNPKLVFEAVSLKSVIQQLKDKFKIEIILEDRSLENCAFSASFRQPRLEDVLKSLKAIFMFEIVSTEKEVILKGGKCQ